MNCARCWSPTHEHTTCGLGISLAPRLPRVNAHGALLQQVILNLARNAFEALLDMPPGARRGGDRHVAHGRSASIEIRVVDNGPGIAPQIADRLFDPFATTKGSGTGLGLAMSRTIVQTHRGTIGVRKHEPRGSTFYVRLPTAEECLT